MEEIEENENSIGFVINHARIDQGRRKMDSLPRRGNNSGGEKSFTLTRLWIDYEVEI
jgi:hypothetical protein